MKRHYLLLCIVSLYFGVASNLHAFVINITYDSSVTNYENPALVQPAVDSVVQWFQHQYTNAVTVNIIVAFDPGVGLGQSDFQLRGYSYSTVTNALRSHRVSAADFTSVASLPPSDPFGSTNWWVPRAECKVLGLSGVGANDAINDGTVTFASTVSYAFDPTNRAVAGKYDFIGVVQHEISEVLGRVYLLGYGINGFAPFDLFRFTNNAARSFDVDANNSYFSVDNGATVQRYFYTNALYGDLQDWLTSGPQDSYDAFSSSGKKSVISSADLLALDVLGYNMPTTTTPLLTGARQSNGTFNVSFYGITGQSFTIWSATNVAVPFGSWTSLGSPTEFSTGYYLYRDTQASANSQRYYRVTSP